MPPCPSSSLAESLADRILADISSLLASGCVCDAGRLVVQLAAHDMLPSQQRRFNELKDECKQRLLLMIEPRLCRVLPFAAAGDRRPLRPPPGAA